MGLGRYTHRCCVMQSSNVFETSIFACASLRVAVLPLVVQLIGIDSSAGFGDGGVSVCMWLRMHGLEGDLRAQDSKRTHWKEHGVRVKVLTQGSHTKPTVTVNTQGFSGT